MRRQPMHLLFSSQPWPVSFVVTCLLLLLAQITVAQENDTRVHADGKGWRLEQAKIVDAQRPRVLLVGDSILNGYLRLATKSLEGRVYVDAWVNPYHQASHRLDPMIAEVLAHGPYDVIHFNMGLHGWQKGRIPEGQFESLTRKLVEQFHKGAPKAKLIWASSTPVTVKGQPGQLDPEINPVIVEHNRMAASVMQQMGVPVNDLYGLLAPKLDLARGDQFHWTEPAYTLLADAVVAAIERELPARKPAAKTVEPSNAQELAAKKIEQEKAIDEKFQTWKTSLSAEQRRWEETLEACLGSFYLPLYKHAKVQGQATAWDYVKDDSKLPRVLLIGDSISRGYTLAVRKALAGKVNVHRAPENCGPTANGLKKLDIWLGDGKKWDAIHFNFGIHDRKTSPTEYEERLEKIVKRLEATGAKLIWASSTPLPAESQYGSDTAIVERNQIAAKVMARRSIPIDDLYTHIRPHLANYQNPNDCHFSGPGYEFLGRKVADAILATLPVE